MFFVFYQKIQVTCVYPQEIKTAVALVYLQFIVKQMGPHRGKNEVSSHSVLPSCINIRTIAFA